MKTICLDDVAEPRDSRAIDGGLEDEDRDRAVRHAVFTLPQKYRETLILFYFYFHDMDVSSAARSLALPEGTVKARLSRGREMLRSKLSQQLVGTVLRKEA